MNIFNVLHISDLHISEYEKPEQERLRSKLIEDISDIITRNNYNIHLVAVTGDIVDRGGSENSYQKANEFFKKFTSLNISKDKIFFVPGNHDIPRRKPDLGIINQIDDNIFDTEASYLEFWDTLNGRFKNFYNFVKSYHNTITKFGGNFLSFDHENGRINVFLINSSWMSIDDNDYNRIRVGKWQLEELNQLYNIRDKKILNIALMHHPIDWLSDKELVMKFLTNNSNLSVDLLLHGHIHTNDIKTVTTPDNSLTTLVSGIGYPQKDKRKSGEIKVDGCRYSIYSINLDSFESNIWLRKSNQYGSFSSDTELYEKGKETGNFSINIKPLNSSQLLAFSDINLNSSIVVDPIQIEKEWVGREDILNNFDCLNTRLLAITGVGGQGKSALASELLRRYSYGINKYYKIGIWVNCRELEHSLHVKLLQVLEAISDGKESYALYKDEKFEDTVKRLMNYLKKINILLVFDNVDAYINGEQEYPTGDLKRIFDYALNIQHNSTLILTCRPPLNDPRGSFKHIKLLGLTPDEGIQFFTKRNIFLGSNENSEEYCKQLVRLTEGHPWWLGLIAGQILSNQDSLKKCVEKFSTSEYNNRKRISIYFKDIWEKLHRNNKIILRYLTETPYPLNINEIESIINEFSYQKICKALNQLKRFGVIIEHQRDTYNVHPLVKEFIHENFSKNTQKPYVASILHMYLPKAIVEKLLGTVNTSDTIEITEIDVNSLINSVETCLHSRNELQAYKLLSENFPTLLDAKYYHQFVSLTCRTLDTIAWEEINIVNTNLGIRLLGCLLAILTEIGDNINFERYIKKYRNMIENGTVAYLGYLNTVSYCHWCREDFGLALKEVTEYIELSKKLDSKVGYYDIEHTRALVLRDSGKHEESLEYFLSCDSNNNDNGSRAGNIARCYLGMKNFPKAEEFLANSLVVLYKEDDYTACINMGYAYLWISDLMYNQGKFKEASGFLLLCQKVWKSYSPGLLYRLVKNEQKMIKCKSYNVSLHDALEMEINFLKKNNVYNDTLHKVNKIII